MILNSNYYSPTMPYAIKETLKINEPSSLTFSVLKSANTTNANFKIGEIIEFNNKTYLVEKAKESLENNEKVILQVECLQNSINLSRIYTKKKEYENKPVLEIIKDILTGTGWSVGNTNITSSTTLSYQTTVTNVVLPVLSDIMELINGVIIFNKNTLDIYIGKNGSLTFANSSVIKNVNTSLDEGGIITRLYPYGAEIKDSNGNKTKVNITSVNNNVEYIEDYSYYYSLGYEQQYVKDNIYTFLKSETYENSEITNPSKLLNEANKYLASHITPGFDAKIILSEIADIKLNSARNIYDTQRNIYVECRVVKCEKDYDNMTTTIELKNRISYSSYNKTLTGKIDKVSNKVNDNWNKVLDEAIQKATDFIKNGINGYVVVNENEILIMDTKDKNTARKVWRWNRGGLGFSSTGYNGTYSLAMTKDGQIVADMITSGTINAQLIKAGILQTVNGDTWINIEDGTFSFANGAISYDGKTFHLQDEEIVNSNLIYDGTFIKGLEFWGIEGTDVQYTGSTKPSWMPSGEGVGIRGEYHSSSVDKYKGIVSNKIPIQINQDYTLSFNYEVESNVTKMLVYAYLFDKNRTYIGAITMASLDVGNSYTHTKKTINLNVSNTKAKYVSIEFRNNGLKANNGSNICCYLNKVKLEIEGKATTYVGNELIINNAEILSILTKQMGSYVTTSSMEQYCDSMKATVLKEIGDTYASKSSLALTEHDITATVKTEKNNYTTQAEFQQTAQGMIGTFSGMGRNILPDGGFEGEITTTNNAIVDFPSSIDNIPTLDGGKCCRITYDKSTDVSVILTSHSFSLKAGKTYTISGYARCASVGGAVSSSCYITNTKHGGSTNIPIFENWNAPYSQWGYMTTTFKIPVTISTKWQLRLGYRNTNAVYTWAAFDMITLVEGYSACPYNCGEEYYYTNVNVGKDGIKCTYTDGSYTAMSPQGFKYYDAGRGYNYCSLITYGEYSRKINSITSLSGSTYVQLPDVFKGKTVTVYASLKDVSIKCFYNETSQSTEALGAVKFSCYPDYIPLTNKIRLSYLFSYVELDYYDYDLSTMTPVNPPYFKEAIGGWDVNFVASYIAFGR